MKVPSMKVVRLASIARISNRVAEKIFPSAYHSTRNAGPYQGKPVRDMNGIELRIVEVGVENRRKY